MGLKNSPATFQRMVDTVLKEFKGKFCGVFFDDIVIYSNSFEDHLEHLNLVLKALSKSGLTVNPKKVQLCTQKLKYLGHIIEPGKCRPDPAKKACLKDYPRPN